MHMIYDNYYIVIPCENMCIGNIKVTNSTTDEDYDINQMFVSETYKKDRNTPFIKDQQDEIILLL